MSNKRQKAVEVVSERFPMAWVRSEVREWCKQTGNVYPYWVFTDENRINRGFYKNPLASGTQVEPTKAPAKTSKPKAVKAAKAKPAPVCNSVPASDPAPVLEMLARSNDNLIPVKSELFVKFGEFDRLTKVIRSGLFYPTFITGLSGNGKTFGVEQACANCRREMIRVNIVAETDEDDLLGGFRLKDGSTVWHNGPVIDAMERGAILLLDEIDLASPKILCLQPILEGKGIFLKKINKLILPAPGFNVIATANTKGQGSDSGKFIGANILNEAFLERFSITLEQEYPQSSAEGKILEKILGNAEALNDISKDFVANLLTWANQVRKSYKDGLVGEIISTRRLVHIINTYLIFNSGKTQIGSIMGDRLESITLCLNRFDSITQESFLELYKAIDRLNAPELKNTEFEHARQGNPGAAAGGEADWIGPNIDPAMMYPPTSLNKPVY